MGVLAVHLKGVSVGEVTGIDLQARQGRITCWVGTAVPRLALELLVGLKRPTSGRVEVLGIVLDRDFPLVPPEVGFLIGEPYFTPEKSGFENLKIVGGFGGFSDEASIKQVMEWVGLDAVADLSVGDYTDSMRKRLGIVQAVMENQRLILLDEPFESLESEEKDMLKCLLLQIRGEGKSIVIGTRDLCEWVADMIRIEEECKDD